MRQLFKTKHVSSQSHASSPPSHSKSPSLLDTVHAGSLTIAHVSTHDRLADVLTKPLAKSRFTLLRSKLGVSNGSTICGGILGKNTYSPHQDLQSATHHLDLLLVAALAPNIPALYELHFGIPMAGAVISALNTRLDKVVLAVLLEQLEPKIIFVDYQFVEVVLQAFDIFSVAKHKLPRLVLIPECDQETSPITRELPPNSLDYNELLAIGQADFKIIHANNEYDPISVNYTSGSTGKPKGAVYSHRAAYLNSFAEIFRSDMRRMPVFLWTVDMFRCNGWGFIWAVAALGGTNICIRNVSAKVIFDAISLHKVTHFCGAPAILNKIADAPVGDQKPLPSKVDIMVAGALPPAQVLNKVEEFGFNVNHAYGMTEALGPTTLWRFDENERIKCREGNHNIMMEGVDVKDPISMESVPPDGKTIGEVMFRSNTMMLGYLKNLQATQEAFKGGWYRTRDLGVIHPDGYIQLKDRAIDMINSGGNTISTLEVEAVIISHPNVLEAAVVGRPDDQLGETPCAFVKLKEGCNVSAEEIVKFCGERMMHYMTPQTVVFGDLPVNSTGKIQKFVLREKAKAMGSFPILNGH
ncbi:hypothetical protein F0562_004002 [Nyssa sinensis]|uniref:Uncharacterized protein n=1 Tax=Nyssa sinensis TaxID=561372 RepID=A0A5J5BWR0_9ASTE|nr:hypothetical protein F0562_004002 [Nyssa sinensis]